MRSLTAGNLRNHKEKLLDIQIGITVSFPVLTPQNLNESKLAEDSRIRVMSHDLHKEKVRNKYLLQDLQMISHEFPDQAPIKNNISVKKLILETYSSVELEPKLFFREENDRARLPQQLAGVGRDEFAGAKEAEVGSSS